MNELALFAGTGGGILGGHLLGFKTVCAVERDAYAAQVLAQRQTDGCLPPFPIWSDVCSFYGKPWRGLVDVVSGGFPCQDISAAGKGVGIDGTRSGLWREMARIISEVQPRYVFVENSPLLVGRGLAVVLADLAQMGFDAQWGCVSASDIGAPHKRDRIWVVANAVSKRDCSEIHSHKADWPQSERSASWIGGSGGRKGKGHVADASSYNGEGQQPCRTNPQEWCRSIQRQTGPRGNGSRWWATEPRLGRVAHGVAYRVDRLKAIGNGQVAGVAATAFTLLAD